MVVAFRVTRDGLIDEVTLKPTGVKTFWAEEKASAKALRQKYA